MRVTNAMMADTVVFNTQRALQRYVNLQTSMSSGRRINKPSDDPAGTLRDLGYRNEISNITQYQNNISRAQSWSKTYDDMMADMKDAVSSVKEIAVAMANGNYDATARASSATEVESAIDHFLQLGNSQLESRYLLGGNLTQVKPFDRSTNGFVYNGDAGKIEFETADKLRHQVNVTGSDLLLKPLSPLGDQADLNVGINAATLLSDLNNGKGIGAAASTFVVTDRNINVSVTVDISVATTVGDAINLINTQLTAGGITNMTASIAPTNNAIQFDSTPSGQITGNTLVSKLNSGNGVVLNPGYLRVTDGAAIDVQVNLSGAVTLNDVIAKFNAQMTTAGVNNVTMSVDPSGTSLRITDSNGVPLGLSITDISSSNSTASGLGLVGQVSPALIGTALSPAVSFDVAETTGTVAHDLGVFGTIDADKVGTDVDPRLTAATPLSLLRNGLGAGLGEIVMWQGGTSVTLNLADPALVTVQDAIDAFNNSGLKITASFNKSGRGIQVLSNDQSKSFTVEDVGAGTTAKNMGLFGSTDMMGTLFVLTNALRKDDQEGAGMLLRNLDSSIQSLLDSRADIGSRAIQLQTLNSRLDNQKLTVTKLLSDVEDADIADLVSQLATHENNYQAALMAAGKIIQPTLMDFLKL